MTYYFHFYSFRLLKNMKVMLSSWARQKQARWGPQALIYLVIQVTLVADADNAPSISLCPEHSVPPAPLPKASRGDSG